MDKEKAARILARELGDNIGRHLVFEECYKETLIKNSTYFEQIENPVFYTVKDQNINFAKTSEHITKELLSLYKSFKYANYFFMQNRSVTQDANFAQSHFIATPYALIDKSEEKNLEELYYKDVPENILDAMNVLSIDNYAENYRLYIKNSGIYDQPNHFFNFVFSIPHEDQNIECNKIYLKNNVVKDCVNILINEYAQGKSLHFQEYFDCLDYGSQERVVKQLTNVKERYLSQDYFLWSRGFNEIKLDYMQIYKENADNFIEYFKNKNQDDKKTILKRLMNCDYTNKAVADWMDKNEIKLLRKVSMDG